MKIFIIILLLSSLTQLSSASLPERGSYIISWGIADGGRKTLVLITDQEVEGNKKIALVATSRDIQEWQRGHAAVFYRCVAYIENGNVVIDASKVPDVNLFDGVFRRLNWKWSADTFIIRPNNVVDIKDNNDFRDRGDVLESSTGSKEFRNHQILFRLLTEGII